MSKEVKTLESLNDSRLLYEKDVPAFGYFILLVVSVAFAGTVYFSTKIPKLYTIEAKGIVTNTESNYVMSAYSGEIEECYLEEGALVKEGDILLTVKSTDFDLQEEQLLENKDTYQEKVENYQLLVKSIKDNVNYFEAGNVDNELYYSIFESYKSRIAQNTLDASSYKNFGYTDEQIENEFEKNQGKLAEIYYSAIQDAENEIEAAKLQMASIESQLFAVRQGQAAYVVKAPSSGVIHMLANYKSGMVVQGTNTIATITPENDKRILEAYVTTEDMARMKEGDLVQIVIDGLVQSVYGTINGKVIQIDSDVSVQEGNAGETQNRFRILIDMETDYLVSKTGDKINVVNGMTAVARIQYDKITFYDYFLEKLGYKIK